MMNRRRFAPAMICLSAVLACAPAWAQTQPSELLAKLKALPGVVSVEPMAAGGRNGRGGAAAAPREAYTLLFEQPVDHTKPDGEKFRQRVYVAGTDFAKPVLLGTEGYAANGLGGGELQRVLAGNQVTVEHRYFGRSVPAPAADGSIKWQYLTVKNAADDMHAVVSALKTLYTGKWVATGASKGGQTSLFYKCYYPDDVNATVAYVAPINVQQEDPRINEFINTSGDAATRKRIKDFQIALFQREDEILPLIKAQADNQHWTFGMGIANAYEYGVLEYPYAFWQYGTAPADIPAADASAETLVAHYNKVGTLRYYSDQGKKQFEPFLYQAFTEIGYYNYDITDFKQFMKSLKNPTNLDICPDGTKDKIVYNPAAMTFVYHYLQYSANNVAYIYGETDAWSATQMQLIGRTNAIKIVVKDAHHNANVRAMSAEQKTQFFDAMDKWLDMKLPRE